jgi:sensor c-di-GMP phosphodiesterase-like protein
MLARWPRAEGIQIGPDQFVPVAEETGLINENGRIDAP